MSNLNRPYEISVWDDILEGEEFVEKRLGVIGSDKMLSQNRALNPSIGRNVNGNKTFQFDMYRFYNDNVTGERVENPFVGWLISERKVKLKYAGKWYDFIVKDISENSSTYLYTYKLEDAAVIELSKNGFGVTLDEQLNNNLGNSKTLAERVLEDTDWKVESEVIVQKTEEALVWIKIPSGKRVVHLLDQDSRNLTVGITEVFDSSFDETKEHTVLAFYGSCTNKPHRFQFIYIKDFDKTDKQIKDEKIKNYGITTDKNDTINNINCQYYIEFEPNDYKEEILNTTFILPEGFSLVDRGEGYLYTGARAEKYNYAHQAEFSKTLDRYINKYHKYVGFELDENGQIKIDENGQKIPADKVSTLNNDGYVIVMDNGEEKLKEYYGYCDNEYFSPTVVKNIITNTRFDSTAGWTGTKNTANATAATVRNVYGYFGNKDNDPTTVFIDSAEEILEGTFDPDRKDLCAYLEITFGDDKSLILNSGPTDNRFIIENMDKGTQWLSEVEIYNNRGQLINNNIITIKIGEYEYNPNDDYYEYKDNLITFDDSNAPLYTVKNTTYTKETFKKKSRVSVGLTCASGVTHTYPETYYIKKFDLFRLIKDDNNIIIKPNDYSVQANNITQSVIKTTYNYFTKEQLDEADEAKTSDALKFDFQTEELSYKTYVPVYNVGAEKVRSISAKESNYFNILQSIAETFGVWLDIEVDHNEDGTIKEIIDENGTSLGKAKWVRFKNYIGKTNYANFRYGVNLKDIQRTYASKEIVTKLIVKQNSNQYAPNGFCAIGRANNNISGEDYIYDFRYFDEKGLLNSSTYFKDVYVLDNGKDKYLNIEDYYKNTDGYFSKIKELNHDIDNINDVIILPNQKELATLESNLAVAEAGYDAAVDNIEKLRENFIKLTGVPIDSIAEDDIEAVEIANDNAYTETDVENKKGKISYLDTNITVTSVQPFQDPTSKKWSLKVKLETKGDNNAIGKSVSIKFYPKITVAKKTICKNLSLSFKIEETGEIEKLVAIGGPVDRDRRDVMKKITEYATYHGNKAKYSDEKENYGSQIITIKNQLSEAEKQLKEIKENKTLLNKAFYTKYSRFIQEGTWIDEKYSDNNLYYADALSVMYNSCHPKVAYTINVISVNSLSGYENFVFELGDTTYVEDAEFFDDKKEEVVITEYIEFLDEPDKDQIKVQNFKQQFQDLFQKITATVQQAQYSTGSYEKAVALAEANAATKREFLTDALNSASSRLTSAGQQSVVWGSEGLTITDVGTPSNQIKMIGGAILLKKKVKDQEKWTAAITSDGISADLIYGGIIKTNEVSIMNSDDPVFRWDEFGITAYSYGDYEAGSGIGTVSNYTDTTKFVRFDKYGLYGIDSSQNDKKVDGATWHATGYTSDGGKWITPNQEIQELATFALTWEGLKVTGFEQTIAQIGKIQSKDGQRIISIKNKQGTETFSIDNFGNVSISGNVKIGSGYAESDFVSGMSNKAQGKFSWDFDAEHGIKMYSGGIDPNKIAFQVFEDKDGINKLEMRGRIISDDGSIGGWSINGQGIFKNNVDGTGLGMWSTGSPDNIALQIGKTSDSINTAPFRVEYDGTFYATNANIDGIINATGGTIADFRIQNGGIESLDISITPTSIYFPKNSLFNLSNLVKIYHSGSTSYLETTGEQAFEVKNQGGAGIRFSPTKKEQQAKQTITFGFTYEQINEGTTSKPKWKTKVHIKCTGLTGMSTLSAPITLTFYFKAKNEAYGGSATLTWQVGTRVNDSQQLYTQNGKQTVLSISIDGTNYASSVTHTFISISSNNNILYSLGSFCPSGSDKFLGDASHLWAAVYASTPQINTSDRNMKKEIKELSNKYENFFNSILPKTFQFIDGTSNRKHVGFIAQEIEESLLSNSLSTIDFAGICIDKNEKGDLKYFLRYEEFIALNTWQIQKLKPRMTAAEEKIQQLEFEVAELKQELATFKNQ